MTISPHQQRILTAVVLLPLLGAAIYLKGILLFGTLVAVNTVAQWEFYSLFWQEKRHHWLKLLGVTSGAAILATASLGMPWVMLAILLGLLWFANLAFLFSYGREGSHPSYTDVGILVSGQLYLPLILQLFLPFSPLEIVFVLAAVFATDTGAYYAGTTMGKRKLWPAISPKKTWMGGAGGLAACLAVSLALGIGFGRGGLAPFLVTGLLINIAAQFGDLFESALKRSARIKDSGAILPGHGGMLDRIDSLLLALPVYALLRLHLTLF
jgi:phosphatidate cytidylyltransferase